MGMTFNNNKHHRKIEASNSETQQVNASRRRRNMDNGSVLMRTECLNAYHAICIFNLIPYSIVHNKPY